MKKIFVAFGLIAALATSAFAGTGKFVDDTVLDAGLSEYATATTVHFCTSMPANYAGIAAVTKANKTVTAGAGNGNWTIANGDTSGRKLTMSALTTITLTGNGTITHQCFAKTASSVLKGCVPLGADKTIVDYTTETWTSSAVDVVEIADITQ